ncbi:copper chaperone PCu(A)C [Streptomyces sp. LX-29]|uniref:copper chaperone PCu(A)C n=1 Tax=Streptomyces sp. LX-29 TaxID=2900152 RepID=UPI00240DAD60|nr:copper chaperone PCu(A)C [Streptomyces sp. LX-29]WFB10842.1 copper chaperone PCu(A)C [Streptomyces sp. LX-29]
MDSASTDRPAGAARRWRTAASAARPALVPVGAGVLSLVLLSGYTATGAAGEPPARIEVVDARVDWPGHREATAAFFDIRNTGGSDDTLESVDSPALGITVLGRRSGAGRDARMRPTGPVEVPAQGRLRMTRDTLDVMILDPPALKPGQRVPFTLWFRDSGPIRVTAVTAGPGRTGP